MPAIITTVRTFLGYTVPEKALGLFFDSLAVQINAGRPIPVSLVDASYNSGDRELQHICQEIAPKLRQGLSLTALLRPYRHRFPEIVFSVIEIGELSGGLADAAQRLADTSQQITSVQREMKTNAYSHSKILLILCLVDFIIQMQLITRSVPLSIALLESGMKAIAFGALIVLLFFASRIILRALYRWYALRLVVDTIKLALPGLGIVSRNLSAARWARSFAVLWRAGVNVSYALEVSSHSALNAHYEKEFGAAAKQTRMGRSITECIARTQLLPPHLLQVVRTCEMTGRMDDQLIRMAGEMERDALNRSIREMNRIVLAFTLLLMAIAVLYAFSGLVAQ